VHFLSSRRGTHSRFSDKWISRLRLRRHNLLQKLQRCIDRVLIQLAQRRVTIRNLNGDLNKWRRLIFMLFTNADPGLEAVAFSKNVMLFTAIFMVSPSAYA
jgi:hypothetical protein